MTSEQAKTIVRALYLADMVRKGRSASQQASILNFQI